MNTIQEVRTTTTPVQERSSITEGEVYRELHQTEQRIWDLLSPVTRNIRDIQLRVATHAISPEEGMQQIHALRTIVITSLEEMLQDLHIDIPPETPYKAPDLGGWGC